MDIIEGTSQKKWQTAYPLSYFITVYLSRLFILDIHNFGHVLYIILGMFSTPFLES